MYNRQKRGNKIGVLLVTASLALSQLACNLVAPNTPEAPPPDSKPAPEPTEPVPGAQDTPLEPEQAGKSTLPVGPGMACLGSFGHGLTCLNETGWQTFDQDNSPLGNNLIKDIAVCPDKRLLIPHALGISAFDGETWQEYEQGWGHSSINSVACDAAGGIWVAHFGGLSYYDGKSWTTHPAKQLSTGSTATDLVEDVVVAPGGRVWVMTASSVAMLDSFDGDESDEWTVFQDGQGFDKRYFFDKIALDEQGQPWVAHSNGLLVFDGEAWTAHDNRDLFTIESLAVDAQGRAWVGTVAQGVYVFENGSWSVYDIANSELGSDHARDIAIDAQNRVWLASEWGVYVFDQAGANWQAYRMDNAGLADNDVRSLAVVEAGPSLPETVDKELASISGRILLENREPAAGAMVEICVEFLGSRFLGETPCADQPFVRQAEMNADGHFVIPDLPAGFYVITVNTGQSWVQLTDEHGITSERVLVEAGQETLLGEIVVTLE